MVLEGHQVQDSRITLKNVETSMAFMMMVAWFRLMGDGVRGIYSEYTELSDSCAANTKLEKQTSSDQQQNQPRSSSADVLTFF